MFPARYARRLAPPGVAAKLSDVAAGAVRQGVNERKEVGGERRITFLDPSPARRCSPQLQESFGSVLQKLAG